VDLGEHPALVEDVLQHVEQRDGVKFRLAEAELAVDPELVNRQAGASELEGVKIAGVRVGARALERGRRVQHGKEVAAAAAHVKMAAIAPGELPPGERVPAEVMARERAQLSGHGRHGTLARRANRES